MKVASVQICLWFAPNICRRSQFSLKLIEDCFWHAQNEPLWAIMFEASYSVLHNTGHIETFLKSIKHDELRLVDGGIYARTSSVCNHTVLQSIWTTVLLSSDSLPSFLWFPLFDNSHRFLSDDSDTSLLSFIHVCYLDTSQHASNMCTSSILSRLWML